MRLYPSPKVILSITLPLLISGLANAFVPIIPENQLAFNDRYTPESFEEANFFWHPTVEKKYQPMVNQGPVMPGQLRNSLNQVAHYLRSQNPNQLVARQGANIPNHALSDTLNRLLNWNGGLTPQDLQNQFELIPLAGYDQPNTKFTGYYTPIIQASDQPSDAYRYPIYRSPMAGNLRLLSRNMISQGSLQNKGLEIAWTNDPIGLFYMQIQGSGILEYQNSHRQNLSFGGSNEKPFRSMAKHMRQMGYLQGNLGRDAIQNWLSANPRYLQAVMNSNPRYVFFKPSNSVLLTASGLPIVPGLSVAVDTDFIPFGSVLLAEVPIKNTKGQSLGSEWKILLPHDRGIAIKGPARMDIYTGKGESARVVANRLTGIGKAFLLNNKSNTQLSLHQSTLYGNTAAF